MKKYELLEKSPGDVYYQIRALRDIPEYRVKAGDVGGLIEKESNLSQEGNGWIEDGSLVRDYAKVLNGRVAKGSRIFGKTIIDGGNVEFSDIFGDSMIGEGVDVRDSNLTNVTAIGKVQIMESTVLNVSFLPQGECFHYLDEVDLKVTNLSTLFHTLHWEKAILIATNFEARSKCVIHNSNIRVLNISIREETEMEYVATENPYMSIRIGDEKNPEKSMLSGFSIEEPLRMASGFLTVRKSTVKGAAFFEGNILLENSVILDYATIVIYGNLINSTLKDCSSIIMEGKEYQTFENLYLDGDATFKIQET